jgi:hypothetical protein
MFKLIRFLYSMNRINKPQPIGKYLILPVFVYTNYASYILIRDENIK